MEAWSEAQAPQSKLTPRSPSTGRSVAGGWERARGRFIRGGHIGFQLAHVPPLCKLVQGSPSAGQRQSCVNMRT